MKVNLKTITYFLSGVVLVAAPLTLIKTSHYTPRFEDKEQGQAQSWAGAAAYYHMLKADPATGLIDEAGRTLADNEAMLRLQNHSKLRTASALGLNWIEMGPDNVGGRVRAIVFDKLRANTIYAGGISGGIFKSTDGGSTWNPVNDQMVNMIVSCMDIDASGNTLYFGTGETLGSNPFGDGNSAFIGNGVYKMDLTTNAITSVTSTVAYKNITNLKCHKTDNNTIYLGTNNNGFKISKDGGTTWSSAKLASTSAFVATSGQIIDVKVGTDGSYVFGYSTGIFRSTAGDEFVTNITPATSLISSSDRYSPEIAIAPSNPNIIYLSCSRSSSLLGGVCQSLDGGLTWYRIAMGSSTVFEPFGTTQGQGLYDNVVTVSPTNAGVIYLGGVTYHKWTQSSPGVGTWSTVAYQFAVGTQQYVHSDLHALEWDPFNPNKLIVGCDGGMFRSIDGGTTYTPINKGFNATQPYAIAFERYPVLGLSGGFPKGGVVSGNQDNGTTYIPGNWNGTKGSYPLGGGDGNYCDFSNIAPDAIFTSIYYGQVNRASTKAYMGGSDFIDTDYNKYKGGPGLGATGGPFASFITPIKLWEKSDDFTTIDSVTFTAPVLVNSAVGTTDGVKKVFKFRVTRTDNSAILDSIYLSLNTGTLVNAFDYVNYTSPALATTGSTPTTAVTFVFGTNSGTITASHYGSAFGFNPEIDSVKITFTTAPAAGSVLKSKVYEAFNSGASVNILTEATTSTKFAFTLPTAIPVKGSLKVPDILQARLAIGLNGAVVVVKRPLNFGITPDWCTVAGAKSKDESGANAAFSGIVQTMEWDPSGDNLYVGTQSGWLYRVSHLRQLRDSVFNKSLDSLNANAIDSLTFQRQRSPIRCTRIGIFPGGVITSIAVNPKTGNDIVVTVGAYGSSPHVYYATSPQTHPTTSGVGLFVSKMGVGSSGLIASDPVYGSLIEFNDTKRVLVGTEHGLYATSDITIANPVWTKENNSQLPNVPVFMIRQQTKNNAYCYNSGAIYAGTHGRGIWATDKYYSASVVGVNEIAPKDKTVVNAIKLYPNPTRDMVNLTFTISKVENLMLNIYDLKGVLVLSKNLGKLPEGEQLMQIGTEDLISGTYIVSLTSTDAIIGTNRLVIVK